MKLACAAVFLCATSHAQWTIQDSHTTADLRGIHSLGNGIAWASGTEGTVLRTTNEGKDWQRCATPPEADHLDFRGVQAFDANTAIVMSIGKGPLSRLYKTIDACRTWTLLFTNPDPEGFWDTLLFPNKRSGFLIGDPVGGSFFVAHTRDSGSNWLRQSNPGLSAEPTAQGVFAASNSSVVFFNGGIRFGTGGTGGARFYGEAGIYICLDDCSEEQRNRDGHKNAWLNRRVPLGTATPSSGVFSLAIPPRRTVIIAVGGDYLKPDDSDGTAAFSADDGQTWTAATTQPHGFRSAVAYDTATKTWITIGPNGTDISTDDGRNWRPLRPGSADLPDVDQHWNALSLPFVVGPLGRVGKLNPQAIPERLH